MPVQIQKDHRGQPGQPLVSVDESVVAGYRLEERGRLTWFRVEQFPPPADRRDVLCRDIQAASMERETGLEPARSSLEVMVV
jgi:hypothetical protein